MKSLRVFTMRSWLARKWLCYFGDDCAKPQWVQHTLRRDAALRKEWDDEVALMQELRSTANQWIHSSKPLTKMGTNSDSNQGSSLTPAFELPDRDKPDPKTADSNAIGRDELPRRQPYFDVARPETVWQTYAIAIAVSILAVVGVGLVAWRDESSGLNSPENSEPVAHQPADSNLSQPSVDLRPLFATAQAGQEVAQRIASATQNASREWLNNPLAMSSTAPVDGSSGITRSTQQVGEAGVAVAQTLKKMAALLQPTALDSPRTDSN